jgi:predicted lipid-binding transport protein (Tim44 family)
MSEDSSVVEIIVFAAIAIVLLFRLRAVLGRKTGEERERSNPFDRPPFDRAGTPPFRPGFAEQPAAAGFRPAVVAEPDPNLPLSLDAKLKRVHEADPTFDEKHFLAGARAAFQMIVPAFASGDLATLRPLLNSQLYGEFGRAISARGRGEPADPVRFDGPVEAEIVDARVAGREVQIQVRFASRQIHPGETQTPEQESIDFWTFAHEVGSRDPNWQLIETNAGH